MKIPTGYKQTEVGVIPKEWKIRTGLEITDFIGKGSSPKWQGFNYTDEGMLFVTSENVRDGYLDISSPKYLPIAFHRKLFRTSLRRGDILVNLVGASIGRSCRIDFPIVDANVNQAVAVFRLKNARTYSPFVAYCLQASATIERILDLQADAARPNISLSDLRRFQFPFPPSVEQRAIAEALSDVDGLIGALDRLIAKKRAIKQAAMQQLLTGKTRLPGFTKKKGYKQTEDGESPIDWDNQKLRDICWFQEGPGVRTHQFRTSGVKLLNGTNISNGTVDLDSTTRHISAHEAYGPYQHFLVDEKDILLATSGITIQKLHEKVAYANALMLPLCMNTSTVRFKVSADRLLDDFLYFFLQSDRFKAQIGKQATGSAQLNFGPSHLDKVALPLPSLPEQRAITAILSDLDTEISKTEERYAKTNAIKQGMMQQLLTGKVRMIKGK